MTDIKSKTKNKYFNSSFEEFIYVRTYSRWVDKLNRRETWDETVNRYGNFMIDRVPYQDKEYFKEIIESILCGDVVPSMRSLWSAGPALERENICGYNCSAVAIDDPRAFSELLYLLMCGSGVGFSVERQVITKLPQVPETIINSEDVIIFEDSKEGWAEGFAKLIDGLYNGFSRPWDLSQLRAEGERLKTFGGRASGPIPLDKLLKFTKQVFFNARGKKLNSLECHDLCCMIASIVVVGGTRRSAMISLSNPSDKRMAHAKDGKFYENYPHRSLSNNSVAYTEKPSTINFLDDWSTLIRSNSGERGIFNRSGVIKTLKKFVKRRNPNFEFLVNPCVEVILRPMQFCNLTEVVIKPIDTLETLLEKVKMSTILGCVQSTLSDFKLIRKEWKENVEEERLLGVSLTGLRDHPILNHVHNKAKFWLAEMKKTALETAEIWSKKLNINMPAAITNVKPSGTVSKLHNTSSGLHTRPSKYYIQRIRVSRIDPLCKMLIDQGIPWNPEVGETKEYFTTAVFEFPIKSPENSICKSDVNALEMLEYWKMIKVYWCEHNPSCTIYVKENEWVQVGNWVYENWDYIAGLSFMPSDDSVYLLKPQEDITLEEYEKLKNNMPDIDFNKLTEYEITDNTEGAQEFACVSGSCDI